MLNQIKTDRLLIRESKSGDSKLILEFELRNKDHFRGWDPIRDESFYTNEEQSRRLKKLLEQESQIKFLIFKKKSLNKVIGEIGLSNIVRGVFQNCNIGYKLDQEEVGKGYMQESIIAIEKYVFENLQLHRIEANIVPRNKKSIQLIERLGYKKEGLSKELLKINGKWEDHYRYAKLNSLSIG